MVTTNGDIASLRRGRLPVRPRADGRVASSGLDGAWPQSGERVIGNENYRRIVESYPGGRPVSEIQRVVGAEDRWVVTPANTVQQIAGRATSGGRNGG
ncbi:MAG TPA: hypothetical protein VK194_00300 [Candidatus Deferrimicrobium sp.]|nr:hypothetical protein [Candidatus Deferrimicrobium sp.]